jgi:hypothetical protein
MIPAHSTTDGRPFMSTPTPDAHPTSPQTPDVGELTTPLLGHALRAFLLTMLGMFALASVVALGTVVGLWSTRPSHAMLAGLGAFVFYGLAGMGAGGHRAVGAAVLQGLARAQLGTRTVTALFDALAATRGARALERLPLGEAEKLLSDVVRRLLSAPVLEAGKSGGFRAGLKRRVRDALIEKVAALTAARFRADGSTGGIEIARVGQELAARADEALADTVRGFVRRVTLLAVLGATVAQGLLIYLVWRSGGGAT